MSILELIILAAVVTVVLFILGAFLRFLKTFIKIWAIVILALLVVRFVMTQGWLT